MGRRLSAEEKILRELSAPVVGAVVAYGGEGAWRIGEVIDVDVDVDEREATLTLRNAETRHTWLVLWDTWTCVAVPLLSLTNIEYRKTNREV